MPGVFRRKKRGRKVKVPKTNKEQSADIVQLKKNVSKLNSLVKPEFKFYDSTRTEYAITTAGAFDTLNVPNKGDMVTQRSGRVIQCKSISARWQLIQNASKTDSTLVRFIFFKYRGVKGSGPTVANLLEEATMRSPRNLDFRSEIKIYMDKTVTLPAAGQPGSSKLIKFYMPCNIKTVFDDSDEYTSAALITNGLYVYMYSDSPATYEPDVNAYYRLRFTDQ